MKLFLALATLPLLAAFQDAPAKADPAAELKKLQADYKAAETEYLRPFREAKTAEERKAARPDPAKHPARDFHARAIELAKSAAGTETAAQAHAWAIRLAGNVGLKDEAMESIRTLVKDHLSSPVLEQIAQMMQYGDRTYGADFAYEILATLRDKAKEPGAKSAALLSLAVQNMKTDETAARAMLDRILKEFPTTASAKRAEGMLFEMEHLQIGRTVPDFSATDEKGMQWKLSDYRGKVTVIDFWGFW